GEAAEDGPVTFQHPRRAADRSSFIQGGADISFGDLVAQSDPARDFRLRTAARSIVASPCPFAESSNFRALLGVGESLDHRTPVRFASRVAGIASGFEDTCANRRIFFVVPELGSSFGLGA